MSFALKYLFYLPLFVLCDVDAMAQSPTLLWGTVVGDGGHSEAASVNVDREGNVYVSGVFFSTLTVGNDVLQSTGQEDVFLAKLDPHGELQWVRSFGSKGIETGASTTVGDDSRVYFGFNLGGPSAIGPDSLTWGGLVLGLDGEGGIIWTHQPQSLSGDRVATIVSDLTLDSHGGVYFTGAVVGEADFGSFSIKSTGGREGHWDPLIAKYDSDGVPKWGIRFGKHSEDDIGVRLGADAAGNIYSLAYSASNFDSVSAPCLVPPTHTAPFLGKVDPRGNPQWGLCIVHEDGPSSNVIYDMATDVSGNSVVAGFFNGQYGSDSAWVLPDVDARASIAKFDAEGRLVWAVTDGVVGTSTEIDSLGRVHVLNLTVPSSERLLAGYDHLGRRTYSRRLGRMGDLAASSDGSSLYFFGIMGKSVVIDGQEFVGSGDWDALLAKFDLSGVPISSEEVDLPSDRIVSIHNYPNPFKSSTQIVFGLSDLSTVELQVYNVMGREVANLLNGVLAPGQHSVTLEADHLPPGVYFYRLSVGDQLVQAGSVVRLR